MGLIEDRQQEWGYLVYHNGDNGDIYGHDWREWSSSHLTTFTIKKLGFQLNDKRWCTGPTSWYFQVEPFAFYPLIVYSLDDTFNGCQSPVLVIGGGQNSLWSNMGSKDQAAMQMITSLQCHSLMMLRIGGIISKCSDVFFSWWHSVWFLKISDYDKWYHGLWFGIIIQPHLFLYEPWSKGGSYPRLDSQGWMTIPYTPSIYHVLIRSDPSI